MYKLSADALSAFKTKLARVQISVDLVSGDAIPDLTESDVKSLKIERAGVSGSSIEIGAARSFEASLELENGDGRFTGVNFDGAKLYLQTITGAHTCPLGCFTVDGHENLTGSIQFTALDRMVLFDKNAYLPSNIFPITVKNLVLRACDYCNVDKSKLNLDSLCNAEYEVRDAPESEVTWRTIIIWACEILGACAFFDAEGYFRISWYEDTGLKITPSDRFTHKIYENDVVVRGVEIIDTDRQSYVAGEIDSGFFFSIEGNELLSHDYEEVAANLGTRLIGFSHRPFTATTLTMPNLFPLDIMTYVDSDGNEYSVCITNCDYTLNGNTDLEGSGESEVTSGFASLNQLTTQERAIISAALKKATDGTSQEINEKQAALIRLNEVIANALGLYLIPVTNEEGGSTQYYFANNPTLEESSLIYVFNAGGFAWADKWGGSNKNTVWNYGITSDGNAVLNYLTVNKLTADHISVNDIVGAINGSTGESELYITADHIKVGSSSLTDSLSQYVTSSSLSATLSSYTTSGELTNTLKSYVTSSSLSTALSSYTTSSELSNTLKSYVTSSSLSTTLSSYTTSSELSNTLQSYVTSSGLTTTLTSYATKTGGTASSFAYSLTASSFSLTANNSTVFSCTSSGVVISGKITSTSGSIGGFTIGSSAIYNGVTSLSDTSHEGIYLGTDGIRLGKGVFTVTKAGSLTATNATITGSITATSGTIGGCSISNGALNISAANITSGTIDSARIGSLSADKITTGTLSADRIPSLSADKITTGTLSADRISTSSSYLTQLYATTINGTTITPGTGTTTQSGFIVYKRISLSNGKVSFTNNPQSSAVTSYNGSLGFTNYSQLWLQTTGDLILHSEGTAYFGYTPTASGGARIVTSSSSGNLYGTWYGTSGTSIASDRNVKNSIEALDDRYSVLFDNLNPIRYKYNDGMSDRYHTGFIAQDLEAAIEAANLDTSEVAAYIETQEKTEDDGETVTKCYIRYSELIALCVKEIQELKNKVKTLEGS